MIFLKIDVSRAIAGVQAKINAIKGEGVARTALADLSIRMYERIHEKGIAADGSQIGNYSASYMKFRTGTFGNSARYKRGKNVGKKKDAGTYSRGTKQGQARVQYRRSADPKIIVSLTRQLENDWSIRTNPNAVRKTDRGWGLGFNNPINYQKARWVEESKKKLIFSTTAEERKYVLDRMQAGIRNILNQ